jgi:uroporphyrinogen decarboxylase
MKPFTPDYRHIVSAARNRPLARLPLYEHIIAPEKMEEILGVKFATLVTGNEADQREFFRQFSGFFQQMGYDTVSYEGTICDVIMRGQALMGKVPGPVACREDFERYPFAEIPAKYWAKYESRFRVLGETMPTGMKAIGGVGNGVFELAQDLVGYTQLCLMRADDPELFADVFRQIGDLLVAIWTRFLDRHGDAFCVCRFGDDLGFKSSTLLSPDDIRAHIIPQYRRIVELVHARGKPFLLHSCGCIWPVMDDIIRDVRIDAKYSNEDQIAPFNTWVERYGTKIGLFGGIDMDVLCRETEAGIREYVRNVIRQTEGRCGWAVGSGNSIPNYVPVAGYLAMVNTVREQRDR